MDVARFDNYHEVRFLLAPLNGNKEMIKWFIIFEMRPVPTRRVTGVLLCLPRIIVIHSVIEKHTLALKY